MNWNKKQVHAETVRALCKTYGIDQLTAAILVRRGITDGQSLLYFLESDPRFEHNPFLFSTMEDAVDRILDAKEEHEKVLIFGDRDVDGITSTTVLYKCLKSMGMDVRWQLPSGDEGYGLSRSAVDDFAADYGSLIITVDCGISNVDEVAYAAQKGIDVIITDHHNVPETVPSQAIIVNPKMPDSGYPFKDISGCAVAYKLTQALRFASGGLYKQEICLLAVEKDGGAYTARALRTRNLVAVKSLTERLYPSTEQARGTRLLDFLKGQQIFVWGKTEQLSLLAELFGHGVEFNCMDMEPLAARIIPQLHGRTLHELAGMSRIGRYSGRQQTNLDGFYNIFVTYARQTQLPSESGHARQEETAIQLVALAALADVMPLLDENRIFLKRGLAAMNGGKLAPGLAELYARLNLGGKKLSSIDLSWNVTPVLNAAGRLGQPELAARLLTEENPMVRDQLAQKIAQVNEYRKQLVSEAWGITLPQAQQSIRGHAGRLCVIIDSRINRGVSGLLAGRLAQQFNVPALVATRTEGGIIMGSMRSVRGLNLTEFLGRMSGLFINYGGHNAAAGFSLHEAQLADFEKQLALNATLIQLEPAEEPCIDIAAELPPEYLTPDLLSLVDRFEPYGEENPPLYFATRALAICDAQILGKTERQHLKLTLDCGRHKWPALFWGEGARWKREFNKGDKVDVLYQISRNTHNGMESAQMILSEARRTQ